MTRVATTITTSALEGLPLFGEPHNQGGLMPTYMCYAHEGQITAEQKSHIAAGIARTHSRFTGAPVAFCQCIFRNLESDEHFIGLQPALDNGVFVYGHIRAERTSAAKNHILMEIRDLLIEVLNVPESVVWVYLNDLAHTDMVEFGRVLPEQGGERDWVDELPADLRDELATRGGGDQLWWR
jgi:phenylpyruvate tautomerase PptA (4-oxalocrotonate tautomerase family)